MKGELSIRYRRNEQRFFALCLILFLVLSTRFFPNEAWTEYAFGDSRERFWFFPI